MASPLYRTTRPLYAAVTRVLQRSQVQQVGMHQHCNSGAT
jgi:hypothetical protein